MMHECLERSFPAEPGESPAAAEVAETAQKVRRFVELTHGATDPSARHRLRQIAFVPRPDERELGARHRISRREVLALL